MKTIVISFDRLPVQMLACYGNRWIETPHFDRLAAGAVVFDQHFAENVDPAAASHAWSSGCYTFSRTAAQQRTQPSIVALLQARGVATQLVRERGANVALLDAATFGTVHECDGQEGLEAVPKQTRIAATVDDALIAIEQLGRSEQGKLLWVQSRGVPVPWLAPRDYATLYLDVLDDGNGDTEESVMEAGDLFDDEEEVDDLDGSDDESEAGEMRLLDFSPAEFDQFLSARASFPKPGPERLALSQVDRRILRSLYGGYVTLLDRELGRLLDAVEKHLPDQKLLLVMTAARGEQLDDVTSLDGELARFSDDVIHVPLMIRTPEIATDIGSRRQALVQTVDLAPTLAEWFGLDAAAHAFEGHSLLPLVRNDSLAIRDTAFLGDGTRVQAVRTPEAYLIIPRDEDSNVGWVESSRPTSGESKRVGLAKRSAHPADLDRARLFLKPEDIWEINDVAKQSPELVESLTAMLDAFVARYQPGGSSKDDG